jgi:two-component system, OmpR family, response regulator CpxR
MPIILISRGTMSGVSMLIHSLAERMGYRSVSREDLISKVDQRGELASRVVEHIGKATRAYEQFSRLRRPYLILMRLALLEYMRDDDLIYHGYSGHLLVAPMQHMLRVRINAPLSMRIPMTMARLGCDEHEAREHIASQDETWGRWARFMYGADIRSPGLYDSVINLHRLSTRAVCSLLQCAAKDPAVATRPETILAVERLLISAQIETAIVMDQRTSGLEIKADVSVSRVLLVGPWLEDTQRAMVLQLADGCARGLRVEYETGYIPDFQNPMQAP